MKVDHLKSQSSFLNLVSYGLTFFLLYYFFVNLIYPNFSFFELDINYLKLFIAFIFTLIFSTLLPTDFSKPSSIFLHIQFLLPILPMLVLYGSSNLPSEYMIMTLVSFLWLMQVRKIKIRPIFFQKISVNVLILSLLGLSFAFITTEYLARGGLLNFNYYEIYSTRFLNVETDVNPLINYLSSFTGVVLLPFAIILSVIRRSVILCLLTLVASTMLFGITNHKAIIFYPFLSLFLYFFLSGKNAIKTMLFSTLLLISVSIILMLTLEEIGLFVTALGVRRIFFTPALLNFYYYEFFLDNAYVLWSNSKITLGLLDYPYSLSPSYLIGSNFLGNELSGANTGWLGSGYMHAGPIGLFLYASFIGIIFAYLDSCRAFLEPRLIVSLTIVPIFIMLLSADFFSALLTNGVLLALLLLCFISFNIKKPES